VTSDVCLVLEGTYPHLTGGVSVWTDRLIRGLPEVSFSVAHLRSPEGGLEDPVPQLPANVVELSEVELDPEREPFGVELPEARVYHALATGVAGTVAAAASRATGAPLVLSEHGIAWREARLGITGCKPTGWQRPRQRLTAGGRRAAIAEAAARTEAQARSAYGHAAAITSVCPSSAALQASLGAPPASMRVIPNGVDDVERNAVRSSARFDVGLVGRVVAVKDVATFVRACRLVADRLPEARFFVIGPLDHEPEYVARCRELVATLGLDERLTFTGTVDVGSWLRRLDAVTLTSISEGQPLAALEAMAAGVPVVTTAVGGCVELLAPRPSQRRGAAGLLVPTRSPRLTAEALLALRRDPSLARRLAAEASRRVAAQHRQRAVVAAFNSLYDRVAA